MSLNQTVASMGLEKPGKASLGNAVTPATWVADYAVNENKPSLIDGAIWAVGAAGAATVATSVGLWKAIVDDATHQQFVEALADEPPEYARHFILCGKTSRVAPPGIAAQTFASKGGAAWQHKNGVWICAQDAKGRPLQDYKPNNFRVLYHPSTPLKRNAHGQFAITLTRGASR